MGRRGYSKFLRPHLSGYSRGGRAVCDYMAQYGSTISMAIIIAGRGLEKIATNLESLELVSILGMDDPWPDMDLFLKDAELHRATSPIFDCMAKVISSPKKYFFMENYQKYCRPMKW